MTSNPPNLCADDLPILGKFPWLMVLLLCVLIAVIRLAGPSDLMDNEQQRQSAYVMDALQNHHWLIQKDGAGEIASKPPLYTWLAAGTSALWPHINRLGVCLPACCATTLLACIVFLAGATFGPTAGFLASIVYLLSMPVLRQIGMARMDALFPLTTTWGALAAYSAWVRGRGWVWFWLACAAATLTKGPLGVLLAGAGLMAAFWEWGSGRPSRLRGHWLISSLVFLALSGGWFAAACAQWGRAVYNKLITEELVPQAVHIAGMPTAHGYDSPWSFITRFAPWSLLCCVGLWRVIFRPAQDLGQRRFERFVFCWLMLGMVFFAAAPHQRADLLLPLYPPAAMLAGRELALLLARLPRAGRTSLVLVIILCGLGGAVVKYEWFNRTQEYVVLTSAAQKLARQVEQHVGRDFPLTHVDDPYAVNFYLDTMRPLAYGPEKKADGVYDSALNATYDYQHAIRLLQGDAAVFLVLSRPEKILDDPLAGDLKIYRPIDASLPGHHLCVLSNRRTLAAEDRMAMGVGPLTVTTEGLKWLHVAQNDFVFEPVNPGEPAEVQFVNGGSEALRVCVKFISQGSTTRQEHTLEPGNAWNCRP